MVPLRGGALRSPEAGVVFALRERQFCASQPNLAGCDLVALHLASRQALAELAAKCDRLGIEHSPAQDRGPGEAAVDVLDPDGTVVRCFWARETEQTLRFLGLCFANGGPPEFYDVPRLPYSSKRADRVGRCPAGRIGTRPSTARTRSKLGISVW